MAILCQCASTRAPIFELQSAGSAPGQARVAKPDSPRPQTLPTPPTETKAASAAGRQTPAENEHTLPDNLPLAIASDIKSIEAMRLAIETGTPIAHWRFDRVRASYQSLLKTVSGDPAAEEAIRARLEQLTRREQAAKAAATIQKILAQSHRRDHEVLELKRRLDTGDAKRRRSRVYQAVGFMQPSAQTIDGRKLFVLIGKNGGTVAYLDIPPGLDPDPGLARKVGVHGVAHYNEELHARLITVRGLEPIEHSR